MNGMMIRYVSVGMAGFLGAISRVLVGALFDRLNLQFPLGTLFINLSGSLFLGWFLTYAQRHTLSDTTRLAIGAGFVGAYTTFSTFMYESNRLISLHAELQAMLNLFGSLALGLLAVRLGIMLGRG